MKLEMLSVGLQLYIWFITNGIVQIIVETRVYGIVFCATYGVKVNGDYYREVLLKEKLLPCIKEISGDNFIFQQDSAPAHRAHDTIALLRWETPDFISPDQWPPNSLDMNPVDYKIWAVMQERFYEKRVNDVNELCQRLLSVWHSIG